MPKSKVPATKLSALLDSSKQITVMALTCQEASPLSFVSYIPCGNQAIALIWHDRDRRVYPMCAGCADHNLSNRGGKLVMCGVER